MPFDDDLAPIMSTPLLPFELADSHCGPLLLAVAAHSTLPRDTSPHQHARGQLLGATRGLLSVDAGNCRWVIPATHAAWIPAHLPHALRSHGPFSGWSLYVAPQACADLPDKPCILGVSALLQAAVARLSAWPATAPEAAQQRLCAVILDELGVAPRSLSAWRCRRMHDCYALLWRYRRNLGTLDAYRNGQRGQVLRRAH